MKIRVYVTIKIDSFNIFAKKTIKVFNPIPDKTLQSKVS